MGKDQIQPPEKIHITRYKVGDRVKFNGMEGVVEEIRDVGIQSPIFDYMVKYDDQEYNEGRNWLQFSNLQKI